MTWFLKVNNSKWRVFLKTWLHHFDDQSGPQAMPFHTLFSNDVSCRFPFEKSNDALNQAFHLRNSYLTFPYGHDRPAQSAEFSSNPPISSLIRFEFCKPKIGSGRWQWSSFPASVSMPKAPVYENCLLSWFKDEIRSARKLAIMQSVTVPHPMYQSPDDQLGFGVLSSNTTHYETADLGRYCVHDKHMIILINARLKIISPKAFAFAHAAIARRLHLTGRKWTNHSRTASRTNGVA